MTKTVKNILVTTLIAIFGISTALFASFTGTRIKETKADEQPYLETEAEFIKTGATYRWNDIIDVTEVVGSSNNNTIKFGKNIVCEGVEYTGIFLGSLMSGVSMMMGSEGGSFGIYENGKITFDSETENFKTFSFNGEEEGKISGTINDIDYYVWFRQNAIRVQKLTVKSGETVLGEVEIPADTLITFGDYVSKATISGLDDSIEYQFTDKTGKTVYYEDTAFRTSDDLTVYVSETVEVDEPVVEESNLGDKISDFANNVSNWLNENTGIAVSSGSLIVAAIILVVIMLTKRK